MDLIEGVAPEAPLERLREPEVRVVVVRVAEVGREGELQGLDGCNPAEQVEAVQVAVGLIELAEQGELDDAAIDRKRLRADAAEVKARVDRGIGVVARAVADAELVESAGAGVSLCRHFRP